MKSLLSTFLLIVLLNTASAQAVLEHTYTDQTLYGPYKLTNYGWVYAAIHYGTTKNDIYIYNESHSLLKSIPIQIPSGYNFIYLINVSDNLFNTDNKIEVLYSLFRGNPVDYKLILKNEDGSPLQEFTKQDYAYIVNLNGNFKMITQTTSLDSNTYVYALPGTMVDIPETAVSFEQIQASPNPCTNYVDITYPPSGSDLRVTDMTGRVINQVRLTPSGIVRLSTASFTQGEYLYQVYDGSRLVGSGKLLKW